MNLSPEERNTVLAVAAQFEKKAIWWKRNRWLSVLLLIGALALIIFIEKQESYFHSPLIPEEVLETSAPTPELNASSIQVLHTIMKTQYTMIRVEQALLMKGMVVLILSVVLFGSVMADWRRDREYQVFAGLLKHFAESTEEPKRTGGNPI